MEKVYEIFIKTTPEALWQAIVDPEIRAKYNFGGAAYSDWTVGSRISLDVEKHGVHLGGGEVLENDPPRRLVHTMECEWDDDVRGRRHFAGDVGDRAGGGLVPPDAHSRPDARRRELSDLRRLADDPLGAEDLARDGRAAHHARFDHVRLDEEPPRATKRRTPTVQRGDESREDT